MAEAHAAGWTQPRGWHGGAVPQQRKAMLQVGTSPLEMGSAAAREIRP